MGAHQNTWERQRGLDAFIIVRVMARMLADVQTNVSSHDSHMQWFSPWKIRADDCDIIPWHHEYLSCYREGTIKEEHYWTSGLSSGYSGTKHLGLLMSHKPSTSAVSVPFMEKSISRIEWVICLSICMYPDLSGEPSVSVTLVVWW